MPQAHYNYYPPAGAVVDENETRAYWNGRAWMLNNRVYGVPMGHRLIGRRGGPVDGWYYDWSHRAWMEPDRGGANRVPVHPGIAFRPGVRPAAQPAAHPAPTPHPAAPHPAAPHPHQHPAVQPEKENTVDKCASDKKDMNVLEYLVKHPIAPLAGAFVLVGSMLADEPQPPNIPQGLPDEIGKTWQMIYAQNLARHQKRMQLWEIVGKALLGYGEVNSILAALPAKKLA